MIISNKNKFVFIKGRKVASTSVEVMLSTLCGPNDIITPITPIDERSRIELNGIPAQNYGANKKELQEYTTDVMRCNDQHLGKIKIPKGNYYNHMPLIQIENLFGKIPSDFLVFSIDRCPYRKIISKANMWYNGNFKQYKQSGGPMNTSISDLKKAISKLIDNGQLDSVKNIDLYKNSSGKIAANVLKYEDLDFEINRVMIHLGISKYPQIQHFKKGLLSDNLDLREIFSKEQIQMINDEYYEEFKHYGYEILPT